ncbi:hypothetical protein EB840_04075 [Klebsiella quasipneumoniae]|uniref:Uncharacterized protein n=1 Tax=Klebsiella quasipneumoniae TaxID=1463165 RepID=A0A483KGH4_9ENTR|nr:hypothetical protein DKC11_26370 [Klebsiella quasipneumoniae]AWL77053.1 hypothetical protein DKC09_30030 [Klebsiella quasipneumoniae]AZA42451.1 hypothetical protein EB840_04075 [Klebsiella quasipneumoniae]PLK60874.1 hypothetical protein CWN69_10735 [Klebsiella quasipneumoniae]PLM34771.1 hypothetical protein CWN40_21605 [Klebsiella quasipneumoniae]
MGAGWIAVTAGNTGSCASAGSASANNSHKALRINSLSTATKERASYRQTAPAVLVKNGIHRRQRSCCGR